MYFFYFYPIGLDQSPRRIPRLTIGLIALMTVVFLWTRYAPTVLPWHPYRLVFAPGNGAAWTVVTAVLLHGGWWHLLGNMVYLAVFGPAIENTFGSVRLLYFFLVLGAWGNVVHGLMGMSGLFGPPLGVLGASGAVAGLLAICLVRFHFARVAIAYWVFAPLQGINRAGRVHLPVPLAVGGWLLLQVVHGIVATESGATVSYGAHFGGFGLGLLLALALSYRRDAQAEACLRRGAGYLGAGQAFAAEGEFLRSLALRPADLDASLQLARARRLDGRPDEAREDYRRLFSRVLDGGDVDRALDIYREARRGEKAGNLRAEMLAEAAFLLEKQMDFAAAVEAYLELWRHHSTHDRAELALVRAIVLLRSRLGRLDEAARWLETAQRGLRPGVWRDFLAAEFNRRTGPDAGGPAPGPGAEPAAAT